MVEWGFGVRRSPQLSRRSAASGTSPTLELDPHFAQTHFDVGMAYA